MKTFSTLVANRVSNHTKVSLFKRFCSAHSKHSRDFKLDSAFVDRFATEPSPFRFNGLGELVYKRSYARVKSDGRQEEWFETVARVVNGTYNMQKTWIEKNKLGWDTQKAQKSAQEMYKRIFNMKFLPPGRGAFYLYSQKFTFTGLWAMGTSITEDKGLYAALNNCAFVSTEDMKDSPSKPFIFLMDLAMLGYSFLNFNSFTFY